MSSPAPTGLSAIPPISPVSPHFSPNGHLPASVPPARGLSPAFSPAPHPAITASAASPTASWLAARDDALAAELRERLAHDSRTAHLALDVRVDGAVAHVEGSVGSADERWLLRRLLRRQGGLYAVWDLLRLPGEWLRAADIGCGDTKQVPWATGVDCVPNPGVDVVTDLEARLPFEDNALDNVFAVHVLEHISDLLGLMHELHRVIKPSGVLHVLCPFWRHVNAVADPTHVRFIDAQTFKYFCLPKATRPGVLPWRPLMIAQTDDTVFADLQPIKDGSAASRAEIARWFY